MRQLTLNQAVVLVIVAAFLPVGMLGFIQGFSSREYTRTLIRERLVSSALVTAAAQREPFAGAGTMLEMAAKDRAVLRSTSDCPAVLQQLIGTQKAIVNLARSSADGVLRCSAVPSNRLISNRDMDWWRKGVEAKRLIVSAPITGKIIGRRVFVAMLPIYRPDGEFDGAVTAAIDASWLQSTLGHRKLSADAVVGIVDDAGNILLQSGAQKLDKVRVRPSLGEAAVFKDRAGVSWIYASAPLFEKQLHVVYTEPEAPLFSPLRNQLRVDLLLPIITIMATCIAIWFALNKFVITWLRELGVMARQFASGGYTYDPSRFDDAPREIAQLGQDLGDMAAVINARDATLRARVVENRAMAREVNHRVKNNLQMVMSLLDLQAGQLKDEASREALDQTRLRMSVIALVHRILYEVSETGDRGQVDLDRLINELAMQMRNANPRHITLVADVHVGQVSIDLAMPICLFLVEAVTSAFRHAFDGREDGVIQLSVVGDVYAGDIIVADDGLSDASKTSVSAMGWQLMNAYASQLNGVIDVRALETGGTSVTLSYKAY